tara:strand:- start:3751 stop:4257 length:507 start_codon:yes stop_codon:yes gene_type:complete
MDRTTRILRKQVIQKNFNNTAAPGPRAVRKQSGKLQKSIRFSKARPRGKGVEADFTIGAKYATTHVGLKQRRKKRITAKGGGALAIPTDFARDARGVPIAPPLDARWKPTWIINDMIFGQLGGQAVPLFTLRKSVVVPQRISVLKDILTPGQEILRQQILAETDKILK